MRAAVLTIIALLCLASLVSAEKRKSVDLSLSVPYTKWNCDHLISRYDNHLDTDIPVTLAKERGKSRFVFQPCATLTYGAVYAEAEWQNTQIAFDSAGSCRFDWKSIAVGLRQETFGMSIRALLGMSSLDASFAGVDRTHFVDFSQSNLMLRPGVSSIPRRGFRFNAELGLPVDLIVHLFKNGYIWGNGGIVDFRFSFGMRLPHSHIHWDLGYFHSLVDNPAINPGWLESFRYGLSASIGYEL